MSTPDPATTKWVPVYGGNGGISYEGDHVPANTYDDGDVVVKDGIAYMCVGGPTNATPNPTPWGAAMVAAGIPTGATMCWFTATPPPGWLICAGQAISRTVYAALFALWGTTYGAGDGSTTFNLPDCQGRMPIGVGTHTDVNAIGKNDGIAIANRTPKHRHSVADAGHNHAATVSDPTHAHGVSDPTHAHGVYDPTHTHRSVTPDIYAYGPGNYTGLDMYGIAQGDANAAYTGIGIYGAATGIAIAGAGTGITVGVGSSGAGISVGPGGTSLDAPPFIAVNWIVKT